MSVLPSWPIQRGSCHAKLRRLYIVRDADAAGNKALAALTERAEAAGIEALALSPRMGDFNEDLSAFGLCALRAGLRIQLAPQDAVRFMRRGTAGADDRCRFCHPGRSGEVHAGQSRAGHQEGDRCAASATQELAANAAATEPLPHKDFRKAMRSLSSFHERPGRG